MRPCGLRSLSSLPLRSGWAGGGLRSTRRRRELTFPAKNRREKWISLLLWLNLATPATGPTRATPFPSNGSFGLTSLRPHGRQPGLLFLLRETAFGLTSLIPPGREPGLLFFTRDCLWLNLATPAAGPARATHLPSSGSFGLTSLRPHGRIPELPPSFERCGVRNHASCAYTRRLFQHGVYNRASCARTGCDFEHALAKAQVANMTSLAEMHTGRDFQHDAQNRVPCTYTKGCFQHSARDCASCAHMRRCF